MSNKTKPPLIDRRYDRAVATPGTAVKIATLREYPQAGADDDPDHPLAERAAAWLARQRKSALTKAARADLKATSEIRHGSLYLTIIAE